MKKGAVFTALLVWGTAACAVQPEEFIAKTVSEVHRAYARHSYSLDPTSHQKSLSAQGPDLFPDFGPTPRQFAGLAWGLTRVNDDQSVLCVTKTATSADDWNKALVAFSRAGLAPAVPGTCAAQATQSYAPASFPSDIAAWVVLDRRDVPSATYVPGYPVISGVDTSAVTRPGLPVPAAQGAMAVLYNPYIEVSPGVGAVIGVVSASSRPGFTVTHQCGVILPEQRCGVSVTYNPAFGSPLVGQLLLEFSNGSVANIGLMGVN